MTGDKSRRLTATQMAYAIWLSTPSPDPRTKSAWSEANKVSRDTLWEWERLSAFVEWLSDAESHREAAWTRSRANLERIAHQTQDNMAAVAAIREQGKLTGKYPSEKLEITKVDRVTYVQPGALRALSDATPAEASEPSEPEASELGALPDRIA